MPIRPCLAGCEGRPSVDGNEKSPQHNQEVPKQPTEKQASPKRVACFQSEKAASPALFLTNRTQSYSGYLQRAGRIGRLADYALDHMDGVALFSIFRHTHETPLFVIEKKQRHPKEKPQFILRDRVAFCVGQTMFRMSPAISASCRV